MQIKFLIGQHVPEVANTLFGIPFAVKGPSGCGGIVSGMSLSLVHIVIEPSAVTSITRASIVIYAMSPRTRIYGLSVCQLRLSLVRMIDVLILNILRHVTVHDKEL